MAFWASLAVGVFSSVATSGISSRRNRKISRAAELAGNRQSMFNARGELAMTQDNNILRSNLAGFTADQILAIGAINSSNIRNARDRNVKLLNTQKTEDTRRHINEEVELVGNIRIGYSSSNISVGSGSAKAVKLAEMNEAALDRKYMDNLAEQQILGLWSTETERAKLVTMESEMAAEVARLNAEFANMVALAEAEQLLANATNNLSGLQRYEALGTPKGHGGTSGSRGK